MHDAPAGTCLTSYANARLMLMVLLGCTVFNCQNHLPCAEALPSDKAVRLMLMVLLFACAGNMSDWAAAFNCKIYLPLVDQQWVTEPGNHISHWDGKPQ